MYAYMQGQVILQYYHEAMILSAMVTDIKENFQYQITLIMMLSSISEAYTLKTSAETNSNFYYSNI